MNCTLPPINQGDKPVDGGGGRGKAGGGKRGKSVGRSDRRAR